MSVSVSVVTSLEFERSGDESGDGLIDVAAMKSQLRFGVVSVKSHGNQLVQIGFIDPATAAAAAAAVAATVASSADAFAELEVILM